MKKLFIGGTAAALIAAAGISTPYYLGNQAKQSLETQHRILADTFFFDIVSRQYQSGWLESTETTVLRFHPTVLANLGNNIPDNIRAVLEKPITMVNHVRHHPFANGIAPVRAVVETEFQYDPEVKKTLTRFFGEQIPVKLHNVINLNGSGKLTIAVAPFDYEELSGIKLNWQGLTGNVQYQNGYASYTTELAMPSFQAILADKGSLKIENLTLNANSHTSKDGKTTLGSSITNLTHFNVAWNEGIDYNIKINDLINTLTDLQIGAFINPRGTIAPSKISVDNLSYATETSEPEAGYLNTSGKFSFAKLNYGDAAYGPLNIDIAANHLNAGSLNALKTRWQQIATEKQMPPEEQQKHILAAVRNEGAALFTDNPQLEIRAFNFTTPSGHVNASGKLNFNGLTAADLNDIKPMLAKMQAELNLDVSQNIIEDFAVTQTRGLFAMENPNSVQEQKEVDDTIRLLTSESLKTMIQDGYIASENGAVKTQLTIADNKIKLNGKPFQLQANEDVFAGLESDASAPAQADSASAPAASAASAPQE